MGANDFFLKFTTVHPFEVVPVAGQRGEGGGGERGGGEGCTNMGQAERKKTIRQPNILNIRTTRPHTRQNAHATPHHLQTFSMVAHLIASHGQFR